MSGRVAILPDALANQIAAGEVVERPASVVKELVENALDAEAQRVVVEIEDAGQRLVRVVDDGTGMPREDARASVLRHATSKIARVEDLQAIATLGFRGEALPSIASVSRFTLTTREHDAAVGTRVVVDGGGDPVIADAGAPPGTRIDVAELFFNTPARLKFLKRGATELQHIKALVASFALGHPHVHFRLTIDGRQALDFPSAKRLDHRLFQVLGRGASERMHAIRFEGGVQVRGFLSEPRYSRTGKKGIHTFVNGRAVADRTIDHAIVSAFGTLLERGRYPHAVVYVHMPPGDVDVNVHPAKAEVRFARPGEVHEAVVRACRGTLMQQPWLGQAAAAGARTAGAIPLEQLWARRPAAAGSPPPSPYETRVPPRSAPIGEAARAYPGPAPRHREMVARDRLTPAAGGAHEVRDEPASWVAGLRIVGEAAHGYLVAQDGAGLYVLDLQAAARALAFEALVGAWRVERRLPSRPLMFPAQEEVAPELAKRLRARETGLGRLGLSVEHFGGATWQVATVPAALAGAEPWALARAALAALHGDDAIDDDGATEIMVALAGHAVRAPLATNDDGPEGLLRALDAAGVDVRDAPTGPIAHALPFDALARVFERE